MTDESEFVGAGAIEPVTDLSEGAAKGGRGPQAGGTPAGFWIRVLATVVDNLLVGLAIVPLVFFVSVLIRVWGLFEASAFPSVQVSAFLLQVVAVFFYYGWFYQKLGATPGKLMLNLKVVDADTGLYLNYSRSFMRETFGKWISGFVFALGYIMVGLRADKRALHDLMLNTRVIREQPTPGSGARVS